MHLVLFDVDGTLVDSQHMIVSAMATAFGAVGRPVPQREAVLGVVGLSLLEAMRGLVPGIDDGGAETLAGAYRDAFFALRQGAGRHEPLFPGARAAIDRLAARDDVLVGLATGKSRRGVAALVDLHGLDGVFATVQTADDHPSKPNPSMIRRALAETGVAPERAVIVGDSSYDIDMARAAGIRSIGVSWGYQSPETLSARGAETVLDRFEDLYPVVARLFQWTEPCATS